MNKYHKADTVITFPQKLNLEWLEKSKMYSLELKNNLFLDFSHTIFIDSSGKAFLKQLQKQGEIQKVTLVFKNMLPELQKDFDALSIAAQTAPAVHGISNSIFLNIGEHFLLFLDRARHALSILVEIIYWASVGCMVKRDIKKGSYIDQMYQLGYKAVTIVFFLALLIGIVLSMQSAIQLKQFGADIFLVPMITISMLREIGPLMTAIILAGRTGSATTAEIATMVVEEEVDALKIMGINHIQYILVPKFWAISTTMPLLSIISVSAGIFGGFFVCTFYLQLSPNLFWTEFTKNVEFSDFIAGFIKSILFSWVILWVGAYYGLKVAGGAEEVGKETTSSVVAAIFSIIIVDAVCSFVL